MTDNTHTPTHCPHCGYSGGFDSLGTFYRETKIKNLDGSNDRYLQQWFQFHCGECDEITAMLSSEECVNDD